jgi:tetratricopeptide (TPR) repeat protein
MNLIPAKILESKKTQLLILITITTATYLNSLYNSFHFDDKYVILADNLIRSLKNLPLIFSEIFSRPLLRATFALNYHFGGLNVFGYHLMNLFFHILVAIEVYILAELLAKDFFKKDDTSGMFPFIASMLFAIHPLHTGSVTYIASRSSVLATAFFLLSFILFLKGTATQNKRRLYHLLSIIVFILSFGVKEIVVTLPFVLTVYVYLRHNNDIDSPLKNYLKTLIIFFVVLLCYLIARRLTLTSVIPVDSRIYEGILPAYQYFITEIKVIVFYYLKWLLLPIGGPNVDPDIPAEKNFFNITTLSAATIIIILFSLAFLYRKKQPIISFCILWYFITLLPTSSLFPLGDLAVERRVYLPSVGFFLLMGLLFVRLKNVTPARYIFTGYICLVLILGYLTVQRNNIWKTELTLWEDAARKSPNKVRVLNNRAYAYIMEGDLDKAEYYYKKLLQRFPEYPYGHNNMGTIYQIKGRLSEAIKEFEIAVQLRPENPLFRTKLGIAYEKEGKLSEAIKELKIAAKLAPYNPQILTALASTLANAGRYNESISIIDKAISIEPANPMAYYILGYSYEKIGESTMAKSAYKEALRLNPGWLLPHKRLMGLAESEISK